MKNHFSFIKNSEENHMSCLKTKISEGSVSLTHNEKKVCDSFLSYTTVKNISNKDIKVNQVSSVFMEIENEGKLKWYDENKYKIHLCQSAWLGEGQWITTTLDSLGMYQVYDDHQHRNFASISSVGSWSTCHYYPLVMVEDLELKKTHYFEIKSSSSWYIEFCTEYDENNEEALYVFVSDSCEKNDGWTISLASDESYSTAPVIYGTVDGGFEEAVASLTRFKRADSRANFKDGIPPVCFNDYMNCCWAMPSYEKTLALVDKAAEVGVEVFCIDDGWQASLLDTELRCVGDWDVSKTRFSPKTFEDIVQYITSKGMKCGAWLEIESVEVGTKGYKEHEQYLLKRRGDIIGNSRAFYDFRTDFIRVKMEKVFDNLYGMGIRYIKNDYNQTVGIGCDGKSSLPAEMRENLAAFCTFIDRIRDKYPDLIIENCGSGAMRCDSETLSHFHLQSTSDQEVYTCNPSIICGSLACMPPEKAGIWSYPYPVRFKDRKEYKVTHGDYLSGHQTAFNMVNSLMGLIYLSGRIDMSDTLNETLIKDAIQLYKEIRADYSNAYPIYPTGTFRLKDKGIFTMGLYLPEKNIAYIAAWKINTDQIALTVNLSKYGNVKKAEKLYPFLEGYTFTKEGNDITLEFPNDNCAMFVKIEF